MFESECTSLQSPNSDHCAVCSGSRLCCLYKYISIGGDPLGESPVWEMVISGQNYGDCFLLCALGMPGVHHEPSTGLADIRETVTSLRSGQGLIPEPGQPGSWWRSDPGPLSSCRYLYNRMGYWSDWSMPILTTTATAFTYIAGLLVRGAEGGACPGLKREAGFPLLSGCCTPVAWFLQGRRPPCFRPPGVSPRLVRASAPRSRCRLSLPATSAVGPAPCTLSLRQGNPFAGLGAPWDKVQMYLSLMGPGTPPAGTGQSKWTSDLLREKS